MENIVLQGSVASFFHVCSIHVRPFFGIEICIDFIMILGAILDQFPTPFRSFWHHFGIFFRYRICHDFLMPFWVILGPRSRERTAIRSITFFIFFLDLSGSRSRHRFWMDFILLTLL